jgi:hypothetical protein
VDETFPTMGGPRQLLTTRGAGNSGAFFRGRAQPRIATALLVGSEHVGQAELFRLREAEPPPEDGLHPVRR